MSRRLILLAAFAAIAVVAVTLVFSSASFTTTSTTTVSASADSVGSWLNLYSSASDPVPADRAGYAHQNNQATLPFVASGLDAGLSIDWGQYPDTNTNYTFNRSFTFRTAAAFPAGVTQVRVTISYETGAGETDQPIRSALINAVGSAGGTNFVTIPANTKRQVNVQIRAHKNWTAPEQFHPVIVLTLTYTGGPAAYYVYRVPTLLSVI